MRTKSKKVKYMKSFKFSGRTGSRSFGATNNDPLEVIVFAGLFESLSWLWWGIREKPQRWGRKPCSRAKHHNKRG
jgi:hypothetical protein